MSDQCADFHSNVPEQQLLLELLSFYQVRCDPVLFNSMNTIQSVKSSLDNSFVIWRSNSLTSMFVYTPDSADQRYKQISSVNDG